MMAQEKVSGPYVSRYQCHHKQIKHLTGNKDALWEPLFSIVGSGPLALDLQPPSWRQQPGEEGLQTFPATGPGTVVISMLGPFPSEPSHGDL